jgi:hypothetical protein
MKIAPVKSAVEYDVYLPLYKNDGAKIGAALIKKIRKQLVDQFGGLTHFRHRNLGLWKFGALTFRDEIIIFRVIGENRSQGRKFFKNFKPVLAKALGQHMILIVERRITIV